MQLLMVTVALSYIYDAAPIIKLPLFMDYSSLPYNHMVFHPEYGLTKVWKTL